jgi:hypothetical protein
MDFYHDRPKENILAKIYQLDSPAVRTIIREGEKKQARRELREFIGWLFRQPWMNGMIMIAGLAIMGNGIQTAMVWGTDEGDFVYGGLLIVIYAMTRMVYRYLPRSRYTVGSPIIDRRRWE